MADVHCGCPPDQALERYKDTAVSESERIEEQFEDLIAGLDLDAPLTFHVGLDVKAAHTWKAPYRDIEARHAISLLYFSNIY